MEYIGYTEHLVFGLDIGTRSIVGTVGYRNKQNKFIVVAQYVKEHETRAMLDGQIHDIEQVAETITLVKKQLETQVGRKLSDVCIAAAGRVLKTVTVKADYEFSSETIVTKEHIHSLDLIGVEKAYDTLREELKEDKINFYCVGYSVVRYYLNGFSISKLEGHKANTIGTELLATFLPDEVIDGLYTAVEKAGLQVANLTLEPIAAINVAIPEKFRLLNIALVDVGAGTSDISITKDGSIIAYGMIPYAGDEITETIVQKYLVEFNEAEKIKQACIKKKPIAYKDIMGIKQKVNPEEIVESVRTAVQKITKSVADKIIELNGDKSVSAVFVVGGGGKIPGFVNQLAEYLDLPFDRVALRGEEVLGEVEFLQKEIKKDPLLVTPIGICLNYYDQKNNFIFVNVNGERVKLYDNSKLTIMDAAIMVGFPYDRLFPRRGKEINFTIDGKKRMIRGEIGEAAVIKLNGQVVGLSHGILQNDKIEIVESTIGKDAEIEIKQLSDYHSTIRFIFNGKTILCPKFVMVNGTLVSEFYNIQNNDEIHILNYYTVEQVLQFMDIKTPGTIMVNNAPAGPKEKIYDNFTIYCDMEDDYMGYLLTSEKDEIYTKEYGTELVEPVKSTSPVTQSVADEKGIKGENRALTVIVNNTPVILQNKPSYIFVDIFDFYPFDLSTLKGSEVVITLNGQKADFTTPLQENDVIELYWKN